MLRLRNKEDKIGSNPYKVGPLKGKLKRKLIWALVFSRPYQEG
jgi:hypothetical protein